MEQKGREWRGNWGGYVTGFLSLCLCRDDTSAKVCGGVRRQRRGHTFSLPLIISTTALTIPQREQHELYHPVDLFEACYYLWLHKTYDHRYHDCNLPTRSYLPRSWTSRQAPPEQPWRTWRVSTIFWTPAYQHQDQPN
jgi:hypothetical protein